MVDCSESYYDKYTPQFTKLIHNDTIIAHLILSTSQDT